MNIFTTAAKESYEEVALTNTGKRQLYDLFFPNEDEDTSSDFVIDRLIADVHGVSYRHRDAQSIIREYQAGDGTIITIPRASEKTPITERLRDSVVSGVDEDAGLDAHSLKLLDNITKQHVGGFNMTKNKQAIDLLSTGKFFARDGSGDDIGLDVDYGRDGSLGALTVDFTNSGTFSGALQNAVSKLLEFNTPPGEMVAILGQKFANAYSEDSDVREFNKNSQAAAVSVNPMRPPELDNTEGLFVVGQFRAPGMVAPVWVCIYNPGTQYKSGAGAVAENFVKDDEMLVTSLISPRFKVLRGIDAFDDDGSIGRFVGDLVVDSYVGKDPVATFIRAQTRHCFVPGNVNHTAKVTGTFE